MDDNIGNYTPEYLAKLASKEAANRQQAEEAMFADAPIQPSIDDMKRQMQKDVVHAKKVPVMIRKAIESDVPFIMNSWTKSYRNALAVTGVSNTIYFANQHIIIEKLAKTCEILVACDPVDPVHVYGYVVCERIQNIFVMHYIYVKSSFRNLGVARAMLDATDYKDGELSAFTHLTRHAQRLAPKFSFIYHPFLLYDLKIKELNE